MAIDIKNASFYNIYSVRTVFLDILDDITIQDIALGSEDLSVTKLEIRFNRSFQTIIHNNYSTYITVIHNTFHDPFHQDISGT